MADPTLIRRTGVPKRIAVSEFGFHKIEIDDMAMICVSLHCVEIWRHFV